MLDSILFSVQLVEGDFMFGKIIVILLLGLARLRGARGMSGPAFGAQGKGFLRVTCVKGWDELDKGIRRMKQAFKS